MCARIRQELVKTAARRGVLTYGELADRVGLPIRTYPDRRALCELLGGISRSEHERGRPLLSVVVVLKRTQRAGGGFFRMARGLGKLFADDAHFFAEELKAAWDYWQSHEDR